MHPPGYENYGRLSQRNPRPHIQNPRRHKDEWLSEYICAAEREVTNAENSVPAGNKTNAHEAYLRASNYYRTAELFRRGNVGKDEIARLKYKGSETAFDMAMRLSVYEYQSIRIPYELAALGIWSP